MASADLLERMYRHMEWADARALEALRAMHEPPPQAVDLFAHVLTAEHVWQRRIDGETETYAVWQSLGLDECERLATANHAAYARILARPDRSRPISYRTSQGAPFTTALDDILLHVSHHGMYHRGQIALLVRASGGAPLSTDYILFARD